MTSTYENQLKDQEIKSTREIINGFPASAISFFYNDQVITMLLDKIAKSTASYALSAAYGGSMGDNGAQARIASFREFLIGFWYGKTGEMVNKGFAESIKEAQLSTDPEYQKYLELKNKFNK